MKFHEQFSCEKIRKHGPCGKEHTRSAKTRRWWNVSIRTILIHLPQLFCFQQRQKGNYSPWGSSSTPRMSLSLHPRASLTIHHSQLWQLWVKRSNPWTSLVVIPKQLMPLWWIRILMVPQVWTHPCADFESRWTGSYNSDILRHLASYSHRTFQWAQRIFRARRWRLPARNWWCPRSDRHPPKDQPVLHLGLRYSCLELQPGVGSRKLSDTWVEAQKALDLLGPQTCHSLYSHTPTSSFETPFAKF